MTSHATHLGRMLIAAVALSACPGPAPEPEPQAEPEPERFRLMDDIGNLHHPITTHSELAQRYFDQGLTMMFGFNHDAAIASFREAADLEASCAMCYWGIAVSSGPNINAVYLGPEAGARALSAVAKAQELAPGVSEAEQAYVTAAARRYSTRDDGTITWDDRAYADAMREVHTAYPDDLDAAAFYAESLMMLSPWDYWTEEGEPHEVLRELVPTLEAVQERDPDHAGANHFYIHAVEAYYPDKAVPAADRLRSFAPEAGHLVHMPSHIYWRVGRYAEAGELNRKAALADEAFFSWCQSGGIYAAEYYPHNIHFLWAAATAEGNEQVARTEGNRLASKIAPEAIAETPLLEAWVPTHLFTLARFGRWDEILGAPRPAPHLRYTTGIWHYARGLALLRQDDAPGALAEYEGLAALASDAQLEATPFVVASAAGYLKLGERHLGAEIAAARGDFDAAVAALEEGVRLQEDMVYTEPPPWYFPLRQALGAILLEADRTAEAEAVYRADLRAHPNQGWSLYGLAASLRAQGKDDEAAVVDAGFEQAWQNADVELVASRF